MILRTRTKKATKRGFRPDLEAMETKLVLSTLYTTPYSLDGAANSLRAAITTANNQSSGNVNILAAPGTYLLTEGLLDVDGNNITITSTGVGKVNIVATSGDAGMVLESGTLTLNNVGFKNGNAEFASPLNDGGAIYVDANTTLNLNNCLFANNYAVDDGGAILNDGTLNVNNSTFTNNTAIDDGYGGAICNYGVATIANSSFSSNAGTYGGALYSEGTSMKVTNSTFSTNTATDQGGAVYDEDDPEVFIADTFTSNTSTTDKGGAITGYGAISVNLSTFTGNTALASSGGAIYADSGSFAVNGSKFTKNSASNGGAIDDDGSLAVLGSTFTSNSANDGFGGAIENDDATVSVVDSSFLFDYASDNGAAIDSDDEAVTTISASTFLATTTGGASQGAAISTEEMCGDGPTVTLTNTFVVANDAGVDVDTDATLNLNGTMILGNFYDNILNNGTTNVSLSKVTFDPSGTGTVNDNP